MGNNIPLLTNPSIIQSPASAGFLFYMKCQYFIIYKPYMVLSQFSSGEGKPTLKDHFDVARDIYPVGRLDNDSEGLLMLTNDTRLNHRLLNPAYAHERAYWAQVDGAVDSIVLEQLAAGVDITVDGKLYHTQPCIALLIGDALQVPPRNPPIRVRQNIPAPWIELILSEGKNRQVRKMTAAVGFPTLRLIRHRIAGIELGNMQPGDIIQLSEKSIYKKLFNE